MTPSTCKAEIRDLLSRVHARDRLPILDELRARVLGEAEHISARMVRARPHLVRRNLTPRQGEMFVCICRFMGRWGHAPTVRELAGAFGVNVNSVRDVLRALAARGWLVIEPHLSRGIFVAVASDAVLTCGHANPSTDERERPVVCLDCGLPLDLMTSEVRAEVLDQRISNSVRVVAAPGVAA